MRHFLTVINFRSEIRMQLADFRKLREVNPYKKVATLAAAFLPTLAIRLKSIFKISDNI